MLCFTRVVDTKEKKADHNPSLARKKEKGYVEPKICLSKQKKNPPKANIAKQKKKTPI
jgi:hypothetical protein